MPRHRHRRGSSSVTAATAAAALVFLQLSSFALAFCPRSLDSLSSSKWTRLWLGNDAYHDGFNHPSSSNGDWQLYNSFEHFLNQCAIQALLFHMNSLKDRNTAHWLEDFTQPVIHKRTKETNRADHETLSNMASAWNDAMQGSYQMEPRQIKLLTYHGLGAMNTTLFPTWDSFFERLLQQEPVSYEIESSRPNAPTYTLDIVPASLCSRILSVREQIAREFVHDLDVIAESSLTAMETVPEKRRLERIHQYFLEMSVHEDYVPSPLRKGNFDLLLSMTTQEAVHRILKNPRDDSGDESYVPWLRQVYAQRIPTHFTGSSFYGRAEDFLEELLEQDSDTAVVERILQQREKVASEWLELSLDVPQSHTAIKRWQLNKLMGIQDTPSASINDGSFQ